jgi:hypothetical protein
MGRTDAAAPEQDKKVIDTKLSLPWLVTTAGSVLTAFMIFAYQRAGQDSKLENKIDQLLVQTSKLEKRMDDRDQRYDAVVRDVYDNKRINDLQTLRIDALEKALTTRR